jgi:hypothetical protein
MTFESKIFNYVENFWLRHALTKEPSIREVARGINSGSKMVYEAIDGGMYCGTDSNLWIESYDDIPDHGRIDFNNIFIGCDSPKIVKKWHEVMNVCEKCYRLKAKNGECACK